jgi:broad-specificity NMP kinase
MLWAMILWLNGTFGAGKTTTSKELVSLIPETRIFDAEYVGYMLRDAVTDMPRTGAGGFQSWQPWRALVVETAAQLLNYVGGRLIVVQTVLEEQYWTEIRDGFQKADLPLHHVVLHTDPDTLTQRIEADTEHSRDWRLNHLVAYREAVPWLHREAEVIDTTHRTPQEAAQLIAAGIRSSWNLPTEDLPKQT